MTKYIHYCWFGNKPLPKLAKKCIKSWKKYFPEYEIIEWNESNFDVNITNFSKQAYEEKKWAFVSDVCRIYVLRQYGGIYFDTDMLVKKNCDFLKDNTFFAGWESEYNVAAGVLGTTIKNHPLIEKIWFFYVNHEFDVNSMFSLSIPTILSNILKNEYKIKFDYLNNQILDDGIIIYAQDYFYPISSDDIPNMFTKRTCMVHYYVGSWLSNNENKRLKFQLIFGKKLGNIILDFLVLGKRILRFILKPYLKVRRNNELTKKRELDFEDFKKQADSLKSKNLLVFYNMDWVGTKNATKELFDNTIGIGELLDEKLIDKIVNYIINEETEIVIFSAFAYGWDKVAEKLKSQNKQITIKVLWHGSNALNVEKYDWEMFEKIFKLHDAEILSSIGFVKKSMYDFYKKLGYRCQFVGNTVNIKKPKALKKINDKYIRIGLYASGDRWVKNFYNQLAAASLFTNVKIDCIPLGEKAIKIAKIFRVGLYGVNSQIPREKLYERIASNDINFYVTFSECAPLIPLESLELGVPCITGNNHHYWIGTKLRDYLVVEEADNINAIYEKALYCLEHKNEILKLYKEWKKENDKISKETVEKFKSK